MSGQMNVPNGYKQTEVGVIPEDWVLRPLLTSVRVASGQVDPKIEPFRSMILVAPDHIESATGRLLLKQTAAAQGAISGKYLFSNGDIHYSKIRPHLRKAVVAEFAGLCSADMYPLKPSTDVAAGFMLAILLGHHFSKYAESVSVQSGMPKINRVELAEYTVALPPTKVEQEVIAEALGDADALIESLEQLIAKKRLIKQGAMHELLTGKMRLPGFANTSKGFRQTEVGLIPEDWKTGNLAAVSKESMQNGVFFTPARKGVGVKIINVGDLYSHIPINPNSLELFNATPKECERYKIVDGDFFFTRSSIVPAGIAHCNIYRETKPESIVFDSHVIRQRPDTHKVVPSYLFRFCGGSLARRYLVSHAKTGTMTTIDQGVLRKCPVILPSIPEQEAIVSILSDMEAELSALENKLDKALQIKQGMMQELLTGRIRLV